MISMNGQLLNTFTSPKGQNKQGEEYGGQAKIQILGDVALPNGEVKKDMFTLTAHDVMDFEGLQGKDITVPIGIFAQGKSVTYFIPKGSKPSLSNVESKIKVA